jgi:hypothetical protein
MISYIRCAAFELELCKKGLEAEHGVFVRFERMRINGYLIEPGSIFAVASSAIADALTHL